MMNDDRLLQALGKAARDERPPDLLELDDRWDRLADGTLSPAEVAELRALAATSEEARQAYEMFRPLDSAFHARVLGKLKEQREAEAAEREPSVLPVERPPSVSRFHAWRVWLGGAVAAATGAIAVFLSVMPTGRLPPTLEIPIWLGGDEAERGGYSAAAPIEVREGKVFHPGTLLTVKAPFEGKGLESAKGGLEVELVLTRGFNVERVPLEKVEWEASLVCVKGSIPRSIPPAADWLVWIVIGRKGKLPNVEELSDNLTSARGDTYRKGNWLAGKCRKPLKIDTRRTLELESEPIEQQLRRHARHTQTRSLHPPRTVDFCGGELSSTPKSIGLLNLSASDPVYIDQVGRRGSGVPCVSESEG